MSMYAVADIHGQLNTFLAGLKAIEFSSEDYLYVLGDAVDRGPDGIKILQKIMAEANMDLIIGNHEFMMDPIKAFFNKSNVSELFTPEVELELFI